MLELTHSSVLSFFLRVVRSWSKLTISVKKGNSVSEFKPGAVQTRGGIQHCECIRDAKLTNVNVSGDGIKEHVVKRFSKQNRKTF